MTKETQDFQTLVRRLDRVERQNKRLRRAVTTLTILGLAVLVIGAVQPEDRTVEAKAFVLRDDRGKIGAELRVSSDGYPALSLYDTSGALRVTLDAEADYPGLFIYDTNETDSTNGTVRIELGVQGSSASLAIINSTSSLGAAIGIDENIAGVIIGDLTFASGVVLAITEEAAGLFIRDANEVIQPVLVVSENGQGLTIADSSGTTRVEIIVREDTPVINFYEADGKTVFHSIP